MCTMVFHSGCIMIFNCGIMRPWIQRYNKASCQFWRFCLVTELFSLKSFLPMENSFSGASNCFIWMIDNLYNLHPS